VTDTAAGFNPFARGFAEDPYPHYEWLRDNDPVHESQLGLWVLASHDEVFRMLRDPSLSVDDRNASGGVLEELARQALGEERADRGSHAMLNRDPPDHTRLRKLVSQAFTPRTVEALRPRIGELVDEKLDRAADAAEMEIVGELAFPLPFEVISEMLGMPDTDRDQLREWSGTLVRSLEPVVDPDVLRAIAAAGDNMRELLTGVIEWKRANPADDLLSALIVAEEHGDVLSDEELLEQVILLYVAGHETTVNLIGNGALALLRHPDQLERLRDQPSLITNAVEELLRYDSPVQMSRRVTLNDVEVGGREISAGTFVVVVLASANRDEAFWGPTAATLDLGRDRANQHVSFGGGAHYCLGAALARLEAQIAIGGLVERFPRIEPAGEPVWNGRLNLRGVDRLLVSVG
jgi:cytochrome P450